VYIGSDDGSCRRYMTAAVTQPLISNTQAGSDLLPNAASVSLNVSWQSVWPSELI